MKNNLTNMMGLDFYLSSISVKKYKEVKEQIEPSSIKTTPLLSWDIFSESASEQIIKIRKEREYQSFLAFTEKYSFQNNFNEIFSAHDFEALVMTNLEKQIVWVSKGFKEMTGYHQKFATTQTPAFLQGKKTSAAAKSRIRKRILARQAFSETVINYKKDNTPYTCEIHVYPLFNETTTHFLALEKQIA
ncbi:PAS domain-containing protein [Mesonia aestuariivivens]|uniref:PAS domain-containing protein n=1 Tax=Mesonia aestuariivivens TaxID=2796128 RepID=A0ABS6W3R8_9FLAO|nr:PAS domain-containing protein [Mesonia aestuariivivens]MBW2962508.1 PAS domain-containing protein [Mesonia aestuariivivens]